MTLFFHLKTSTEKSFRETAMRKYGFGKGSLKLALEDAIGDWLKKYDDQLPTGKEEPTILKNNENNKENKDNKEK